MFGTLHAPTVGLSIPTLLLGIGLVACGGRAPSSMETLREYTNALREERYRDAYELMSSDYRMRVKFEDFKADLEHHPAERAETITALSRPQGAPVETAEVRFADGDRIPLRRENGQWKIDKNIANFYAQDSPRAALRSFVRAMERKRYDVVLRMVPEADQPGMSEEAMREAWSGPGAEEIERLIANLKESLEAPIEVTGNRATMPYGDRYTVRFIREEGVWKIEDPD